MTVGGVTVQASLKAGSDVPKQKAWPKNGRTLSNALRRLAPTLRDVGIDVQHSIREPGTGNRIIVLTTLGTQPLNAPASPGASSTTQRPGRIQGSI